MSSVGNKGKFSDRLKRMKLIRYAKKMKLKVGDTINLEDDSSKFKRKVIGIAGVGVAVIGSGIYNLVDNKARTNKSVENQEIVNSSQFLNKDIVLKEQKSLFRDEKSVDNYGDIENKETVKDFIKRKTVETVSVGAAVVGAIGVNLLGGTTNKVDTIGSSKRIKLDDDSNKSYGRVFKSGNDIIIIDKISDKDVVNGDRKTYLSAQIVKKIRREFEKKLNEIEVLESELYLLNDKNNNELDLEECKKIKKQIEELITKINHIIAQYNIYQYNRFLDDMLDIDDNTLVDDISEFKRLYEGAEIQRRLVSDFELISEYQLLYSKLEDIKTNVDDVTCKNNDKIVDYENRDKKYENMKRKIVDIDKFNDDCKLYMDKQNKYIDDINEKVGKIDIDYITNYKLRGFGDLLGGTFRYLRMLSMMSFSSLLPGISFRNYATYRMVNNLRCALRLERVTSTIYKAEDFQFELNDKINTLDYNYNCVDKTIDSVKKLKSEFMEQYKYDLPSYNETLRKINEIEVLVYNNREKLDIIRNKLKINKKLNEDTLKKCRTLEKESKPIVDRV